jgi:hypothetical protein
MLKSAGISVFRYETLLTKNQKIQDCAVIQTACESGFVLVSKDENMEREWIDDIIRLKARIVLLADPTGNITQLGAALICARKRVERILLDNLHGPLIIKITEAGHTITLKGDAELRARRDKFLTARIVRAKRHYDSNADGTTGR